MADGSRLLSSSWPHAGPDDRMETDSDTSLDEYAECMLEAALSSVTMVTRGDNGQGRTGQDAIGASAGCVKLSSASTTSYRRPPVAVAASSRTPSLASAASSPPGNRSLANAPSSKRPSFAGSASSRKPSPAIDTSDRRPPLAIPTSRRPSLAGSASSRRTSLTSAVSNSRPFPADVASSSGRSPSLSGASSSIKPFLTSATSSSRLSSAGIANSSSSRPSYASASISPEIELSLASAASIFGNGSFLVSATSSSGNEPFLASTASSSTLSSASATSSPRNRLSPASPASSSDSGPTFAGAASNFSNETSLASAASSSRTSSGSVASSFGNRTCLSSAASSPGSVPSLAIAASSFDDGLSLASVPSSRGSSTASAASSKRPSTASATSSKRPSTASAASSKRPSTASAASSKRPSTASAASSKRPSTASAASSKRPSTASAASSKRPSTASLASSRRPSVAGAASSSGNRQCPASAAKSIDNTLSPAGATSCPGSELSSARDDSFCRTHSSAKDNKSESAVETKGNTSQIVPSVLMVSVTSEHDYARLHFEAGASVADDLSDLSETMRTDVESNSLNSVVSPKHDKAAVCRNPKDDGTLTAPHIDLAKNMRSEGDKISLSDRESARRASSDLDIHSDFEESWVPEDVEMSGFHEFLDELDSELKEISSSEPKSEAFANGGVKKAEDACPPSSQDPVAKSESPNVNASISCQNVPTTENDIQEGFEVNVSPDVDSPTATVMDIDMQTKITTNSSSSRLADPELRPLVEKTIEKHGSHGKKTVSVVDKYCKKTFRRLDKFLHRILKPQEHHVVGQLCCQEIRTQSALADATAWMGRLNARCDLSLSDQLMICNKAIQCTLLAWEALYKCSCGPVAKSDFQSEYDDTLHNSVKNEDNLTTNTPCDKDNVAGSTPSAFEGAGASVRGSPAAAAAGAAAEEAAAAAAAAEAAAEEEAAAAAEAAGTAAAGGQDAGSDAGSDGEEAAGGDDSAHDPHFEPIVPLPELVDVKTGEEDEQKLFCHRAVLYRFNTDTSEWKERGRGDFKLLHNTNTGSYRVLLRREQVHKLACNHRVLPDMTLTRLSASDRAWVWSAMASTDEEPKVETFAVKFKTETLAAEYKKAFESVMQKLNETSTNDTREEEEEDGAAKASEDGEHHEDTDSPIFEKHPSFSESVKLSPAPAISQSQLTQPSTPVPSSGGAATALQFAKLVDLVTSPKVGTSPGSGFSFGNRFVCPAPPPEKHNSSASFTFRLPVTTTTKDNRENRSIFGGSSTLETKPTSVFRGVSTYENKTLSVFGGVWTSETKTMSVFGGVSTSETQTTSAFRSPLVSGCAGTKTTSVFGEVSTSENQTTSAFRSPLVSGCAGTKTTSVFGGVSTSETQTTSAFRSPLVLGCAGTIKTSSLFSLDPDFGSAASGWPALGSRKTATDESTQATSPTLQLTRKSFTFDGDPSKTGDSTSNVSPATLELVDSAVAPSPLKFSVGGDANKSVSSILRGSSTSSTNPLSIFTGASTSESKLTLICEGTLTSDTKTTSTFEEASTSVTSTTSVFSSTLISGGSGTNEASSLFSCGCDFGSGVSGWSVFGAVKTMAGESEATVSAAGSSQQTTLGMGLKSSEHVVDVAPLAKSGQPAGTKEHLQEEDPGDEQTMDKLIEDMHRTAATPEASSTNEQNSAPSLTPPKSRPQRTREKPKWQNDFLMDDSLMDWSIKDHCS